jgi:hypothetical protein
VFALTLLISACGRLGSDAELISNFHNHEGAFDQLQRMVNEDDLQGRIHASYADPKLPKDRLARYRTLMAESGVMRLWAQGKSKPIEFIVDATGFLDEGDYKGYLFSMNNETPTSESLDKSCISAKSQDRYCSAVRPLGAHWWLLRYEYN